MILCSIWHKKGDLYTGILADHGDILNTGKTLLENYNDPDKIDQLLSKGSLTKVEPDINDCANIENGESIIFKDLQLIVVKTVLSQYTNGQYVYIFDDSSNQWWFGVKMKLPLKKAIER